MLRKRVLLFTENLGPGGAERQLTGLAVMLKQRGYQVKVLTYFDDLFYVSKLMKTNVDFECDTSIYNGLKGIVRLYRHVSCFQPDVVISFLPGPNMRMCLIRLLFRTHLIVSERNNYLSVSFKDILQFHLYRVSDYVVSNSYSCGNFIKKRFPFLDSKVKTIVNYVDFERFSPPSDCTVRIIPRVITTARFVRQKNVLCYLDAIAILRQRGYKIHFDWFGDKKTDSAYYDEIISKLNDLKLDDYITLHDASPSVELEYQKSDFLCLPSLYEGYPNVVIEAMSCGLPVVCSNVFDNPIIVEDGVNGFLFNPMDAEDMANAIVRMLKLTMEERKAIGDRNRQKVIKNNTEETFVNQYINLL